MKTLHLGNQNMATKAKILFSQKTHPRVPPMLTGEEGGTKMIFFQTSEGKNPPWLTLPGEKLEAGTGTSGVGNNRKVLECRALSSAGRIKEL